MFNNIFSSNVMFIIVVIIVLVLIIMYNQNKSASNDTMVGNMDSTYANANETDQNVPYSEQTKYVNDLLPSINNSEWSEFNPNITGEIDNINRYKAGFVQGIDTIGSSMRNANLQIRSEPPNPIIPTGPWNQSTITPDFVHTPFEIGVGNQ
jgi:hypothetical protein